MRALGTQGVLVSWIPDEGNSPWKLTLVEVPVFAQSKLLLPPSLIPPTLTIGPPQTAPTSLSNSETYFRAAYHQEDWEASLVLFRGWNHLPELKL